MFRQAVKYEMKDFVTSDNSQLALIYIQKGKLFRRLKGFKATAVQVCYYTNRLQWSKKFCFFIFALIY